MEGHVQTVEDNLIDSLSFKLRPGASYVTNRRSVTFWPQGGNDYSPNGVKVIKISLNADDWLDPSTVKIFFDIQNKDNTKELVPLVCGGWGFFRRLRILCGGQIVEDIDNYNRVHEMFHIMKPTERRINDAIEGFGIIESNNWTFGAPDKPSPLAATKTQTIAFTPMAGLFRQEKYLPIRYCPIQIELEIVGNAADALDDTQVAASGSDPAKGSTSFSISNVQMKADVVQLDNTLDNEYTAYLMTGKKLPIHFTALTSASQVITSIQTNVNVSRSLTRLKAVFVSLYMQAIAGASKTEKESNYFWHPMGATKYDSVSELQFQLQIGSKLFPEYPIRSLGEAFYQLRKTFGIHYGNDQMNLQQRAYRSQKFVIGIDLEKVLGSSFTGYNSKAGDLLTLKLDKSSSSTVSLSPANTYKMFYVLSHDCIMNVAISGVEILD